MKFIKTIVRDWLFIHLCIYLFIGIYLPTVGQNKVQWDPSPALRSLVRRTNKQIGDCTL